MSLHDHHLPCCLPQPPQCCPISIFINAPRSGRMELYATSAHNQINPDQQARSYRPVVCVIVNIPVVRRRGPNTVFDDAERRLRQPLLRLLKANESSMTLPVGKRKSLGRKPRFEGFTHVTTHHTLAQTSLLCFGHQIHYSRQQVKQTLEHKRRERRIEKTGEQQSFERLAACRRGGRSPKGRETREQVQRGSSIARQKQKRWAGRGAIYKGGGHCRLSEKSRVEKVQMRKGECGRYRLEEVTQMQLRVNSSRWVEKAPPGMALQRTLAFIYQGSNEAI